MKESRMKKFAVLGLSLLAILIVGVSMVAAQEPVDDAPVVPGVNFIDEDGDGVCDLMGTNAAGNGQGYGRHGSGANGANFVDENGDGLCDLMGTGAGGAGFVDENGDGICDQAGDGQGLGSNGQGGNGFRGGAGNGFGRGMGQGGRGTNAPQ